MPADRPTVCEYTQRFRNVSYLDILRKQSRSDVCPVCGGSGEQYDEDFDPPELQECYGCDGTGENKYRLQP